MAKAEAKWLGDRESLLPREQELMISKGYVQVWRHMKYLGVQPDNRWKTHHYFLLLSHRLQNTAAAVGRLLPNLDGPSDGPRRLYTEVVESIALYGAPE